MTIRIPHASIFRRQKGAALLILLTVLILASSYVLVRKLNSSTGSTGKNNKTLVTLENIKEALLGFAAANDRLPCPAIPSSAGMEDPPGGGTCTEPHGFVPVVTLGLASITNQDNLLLDAWDNPIRYSLTTITAFTTGPITGVADLRVCAAASCSSPLISNAPVVIYSMGADGALRPTSTDQSENGETRISAGTVGPLGIRYWITNDTDFVSHELSLVSGNEFDDLVRWIPPTDL